MSTPRKYAPRVLFLGDLRRQSPYPRRFPVASLDANTDGGTRMYRLDRQGLGTPAVVSNGAKTILGLTALMLACTVFADTRLNVILLVADDMGWAQTGYSCAVIC